MIRVSQNNKLATEPAASAETAVQPAKPVREKREGMWRDVIAGIVSNKASLVSGIFILILAVIAIVTAVAPGILPYDPYQQDLGQSLLPPSAEHWFGTDLQGRDIFCRVMVGTQISLSVGLIAVAFSLTIGVILGSIAGYKGGWVDTVIMRIMDMMLAIPSILLAIAIMAALGPGIEKAVVAIGLVSSPEYARIVRSEILAIKENDYVAAARVIGDSNFKIVFRHVLPNAALPMITIITMEVGFIVSGSMMIEQIFNWDGMGLLVYRAIGGNDYPVLQGSLLVLTVCVVLANLLSDVLCALVDPRIQDGMWHE